MAYKIEYLKKGVLTEPVEDTPTEEPQLKVLRKTKQQYN